MAEENKSELYSKHQGLFDTRFEEMIIRGFPGFERAKFEQLSENDEPEVAFSVRWYEDDDNRYYEEDDEWEEGTISYFSDGMPALDPEED